MFVPFETAAQLIQADFQTTPNGALRHVQSSSDLSRRPLFEEVQKDRTAVGLFETQDLIRDQPVKLDTLNKLLRCRRRLLDRRIGTLTSFAALTTARLRPRNVAKHAAEPRPQRTIIGHMLGRYKPSIVRKISGLVGPKQGPSKPLQPRHLGRELLNAHLVLSVVHGL